MTDRTYLKGAETTKLIRAALKEAFPGVTFTVRLDGRAARIAYTNGPSVELVNRVAKHFEGGYFDGMNDYAGCRYHTLDNRPVRLGVNYVFVERQFTDAAIGAAIKRVVAKYGETFLTGLEDAIADYKAGRLYTVPMFTGSSYGGESFQDFIRKALHKHTDRLAALPSATMARVKFQGDDGYGDNTVGMNGQGGSQCAKARTELLERRDLERRIAGAMMMAAAEALQ